MKNKINKKIITYKNKTDFYKNQLLSFDKEIDVLNKQIDPNNLNEKRNYKEKRKAIKKLNKISTKRNRANAYEIKYRYLYQLQNLLEQYHTSKPNDIVYHNYLEYIESTNNGDAIPYNPLKIFHINRWTKKLNKKILKLAYYKNVKLPKQKNFAKKKLVKYQIKTTQEDIQSLQSYINDTKVSFYSIFHARMVAKLDKLSKNHGIKKMSSEYVIDLKDVTKYYNNGLLATKVLKGVDLQIKYGEFVVILGPSGSGKTTLLNIISGMDTATYGRTIVCNQNLINYDIPKLTEFRRKKIGYVFQQYGLLPNLTIRENVEIGENLQNKKSKKIDIDDLLKTIGIFEHRNKFPSELSGGQQQRVSIARSIAKNPDIIFGDEPTGAIDEEMSKQVMQLFLDVNKTYHTTIIIVTHNPIFADLATMVIKVNGGKIANIIRNKHRKSVNELNWTK